MVKQTGLGDALYVDGRDISGDIQSLGRIGGGPVPLDVTGIDKAAFERLGGLRDGSIEAVSFFNPGTDRAHAVLSALPTADVIVSYCRGTVLGNAAACVNAKQVNYDPTRGQDGSLTFAVTALANETGLEWGRQLTAGTDTFTGAAAGASVDLGAQSPNGLQAYLHVFSFTGTDATVALQRSSDDGAGDAYEDIPQATFTQITAAPTAERVITNNDIVVEQFIRINVTTSAGFSDLDLAVVVVQNVVTVAF